MSKDQNGVILTGSRADAERLASIFGVKAQGFVFKNLLAPTDQKKWFIPDVNPLQPDLKEMINSGEFSVQGSEVHARERWTLTTHTLAHFVNNPEDRKPPAMTLNFVTSPEGISCNVLNTEAVDFSDAREGRKATETIVKKAIGGEVIETKNSSGQTESSYIAKAGDAIFINIHNPSDIYVPGNPDGSRWQFDDVESKGYEISARDGDSSIRVKSTTMSKILHECITKPVCILDAWGEGQHQFLYKGASLKLNSNGSVTGIDKEAFDATWEIANSNILVSAQPSNEMKLAHG